MKMKAAEPQKRAAEPEVGFQFFPSHSSRDFAARFRSSAAEKSHKAASLVVFAFSTARKVDFV